MDKRGFGSLHGSSLCDSAVTFCLSNTITNVCVTVDMSKTTLCIHCIGHHCKLFTLLSPLWMCRKLHILLTAQTPSQTRHHPQYIVYVSQTPLIIQYILVNQYITPYCHHSQTTQLIYYINSITISSLSSVHCGCVPNYINFSLYCLVFQTVPCHHFTLDES